MQALVLRKAFNQLFRWFRGVERGLSPIASCNELWSPALLFFMNSKDDRFACGKAAAAVNGVTTELKRER
ncbi:hypothetical protein XH98_37525 [Bradyrhizobium sp. CCBAU 51745]|nr:hypothetical protein [Bradyrhizobium sp. CCBAU 51745]